MKRKPKFTFEKRPPVAKKANVENIKAKEKKAKAEEANEFSAPADVVVWPEKPMKTPDNVPDAVLFAAAAAGKATLRETRGKYATNKSQVQCPFCEHGPFGVRELRRHKRTCKANPRTLHPRGPGKKSAPGFASKEGVHTYLKQSGWKKAGRSVTPGLGSGVQKGQQWNRPAHGKLWVGTEKLYHQPHHMAGKPVSNKIFWKQTADPKKQPVEIQKMFPSGKPPAAAPVDLNKLAEKVQPNEGAPPKPPAIKSVAQLSPEAWAKKFKSF